MKKINQCPICKNEDFIFYKTCLDYTTSKKTFTIEECKSCQYKFTNPRPEEKDLGQYYVSEEYISHTDNNKGILNKAYIAARIIMVSWKTKMLGKEKGSLLEIGSGTAELLARCQQKGWNVTGVEPSKIARENAYKKHKIKLYENLKQAKIKDESQDLIMMWHVLEHIPNPEKLVAQLHKILKTEGRLIIAVPNHKSFDAKYYDQNWAAYDVPRHLSHFDRKTMSKLLKNNGLEIKKTKPMWLDSIYVSMLSEKIKRNKINYLKATIIGVLSNIRALIYNKEYSSIIYIAKKRT
jgi:2-polyprenyl-3-methyl-5-hydroxy-6-metoxy-1,4-benzoquinol methylase